MNDYTEGGGGLGCLLQAAAVGLALLALMALAGGDSTGNTSSNAASMEALSRNQVNLWSDVTNEFVTCAAPGSCVTQVTTTSTTSTQASTTNVDGDRNVIYSSAGVRLCVNPDNPNEWGDVAAWCEAAGVTP
jgi:hypothetical protein